MVHQITNALDHHAAIITGATPLRRIGFLLQLAQRRGVLLLCAGLVKLRLKEIHHLVKANIAPANRRQQLVDFIEVVARQQVFFGFFQADAKMRQLVVEDLTTGDNVFIAILFAEPGVNFGARAAGADVAEVRVQPVAARVRLFLGDDFNLIAHLQLIGKRHDPAADFRADAAMPDIARRNPPSLPARR